ncbi:anaerobic ribonucleoside-triphosphate reductase activating protein [Leptotrichia massiliensis]|uniref:anaerobic ribonucleoside-triphosphate reductase activating protein n=1 Tax=Leptotrichia massiliensis TaxID=1852388 RepID=UPI0009F484B7|nr:anaerobic ribonucleoside-triphosphate reductase activating protein [Leptotrichia massiliensis]
MGKVKVKVSEKNSKNDFTLRLLMTYKETIVDGEGLRYSLYFAGCSHACPSCHNEYSWNPKHGNVLTYDKLEEIAKEINENTLLDGITISGGDPLFNPADMLKVLKFLKEKTKKNIWLYTGYTLEQVQEDELRRKCLEYVDVLVDGRFVKELYDPNLKFRGSSNQRIIKKEDFFI